MIRSRCNRCVGACVRRPDDYGGRVFAEQKVRRLALKLLREAALKAPSLLERKKRIAKKGAGRGQ